jgi:V/A-type H+-transporting ATPase subunit F
MMELAVFGAPEFTLGFRLSGITKVVDVDESGRSDADKRLLDLIEDQNIGIIIADDRTMNSLSERMRERAESLVRPVIVIVSAEPTAQETLRKMIIKSIGVDLWKQ